MVNGFLSPTHIVLLLVVALMLFGAKRLPEVGRSLGTGLRGFKHGLEGSEPQEPERPELSNSRAVVSSAPAEAPPEADSVSPPPEPAGPSRREPAHQPPASI